MSPADKSKALIPYVRQSRKKEQTISLDDQLKSIRAWAKSAGVKLATEVVEQGVSGSKPWRERELGRAVEACQRGEAGGIVVAFQDRLSRENGLATAEVWEALDKAQARLVASSEGLDTATGDHEMLFSIKAAIAREQWKRHRLNWANAKHASWEAGQYVADLPAGYDRGEDGGLVPGSGAETIRRAFELRASTPRASWGEVARVFEEAGVLTRRGRADWTPAALRFLIGNEVYTGLHRCTCGCGESVVRLEWEVVPGWLWRKAQVEPTAVPAGRVRGDGHPLGQGLVKCSTCETSLIRTSSARGVILRCPARGAGHASIMYEPVREWILTEVTRYVGIVRKEEGGNDAEVAAAQARLDDARGALEEMEAQVGVALPAGSIQRIAVQDAEDALAAIDKTEGAVWFLGPSIVKEQLESLPVAEQRRALRSVVERVVLSPGRSSRGGSLAARVTIYFADGSVSTQREERADDEAEAKVAS